MQNNLIDKQLVDTIMKQCGVSNLDDASIRDTVKIVNLLEKATGEKFIRMEMGVPGLAPSRIGTEAEIEALKQGVAQFYPMLEGYPALSKEASRFVKNFMDIDIRPEGISNRRSHAGVLRSLYGFDRMPERERYDPVHRSGFSRTENPVGGHRQTV